MKQWLLLVCLAASGWAEPLVRVVLLPPEAQFSVRHSSGAALPGGPDPRALLPSESEFLAHEVNGERGITLAVRREGYEDFERTFPLAQGKDWWVGSRRGWEIPIELHPVGAWSGFRHNLRFHPWPIYLGAGALVLMIGIPLRNARRTLTVADEKQREAEWLKDRYEQDLVGREVDSYRIERKLGEGSYAQVFLARHLEFGDVFALKILRPYLVEGATLQRISRELEIGRRLKHPGLVRIVAFGTFHEAPYLVMDFVEGETLAAVLEQGPLEVHRAVNLLVLICEGVAYAHQEGVMHRDLKPENIMLTPVGGLKVLDFGVARPTGDWATLTGTGQAVGTPAYMAPEQLLGNPGFASDVYALGVILFVMLRGHLPFVGGDVVAAHLSEKVPPLESGLDWLDALCASMLEKSLSQRVSSVDRVLQSLRAFAPVVANH